MYRGQQRMASEPDRNVFHRRDRLHVWVRVLSGSVFAVLAIVLGAGLWLHRSEALKAGQSRAENLAHILADHLGRTISATDAALVQLVAHSGRVGGPAVDAALWMPVLDSVQSNLAGVGSLSVTDETGKIVHSTVRTDIGQSRAETYVFRHLASEPAAGLMLDAPFRGSVTGRLLMPLARPLVSADGRFAGIVVATLEPALLRDFYRTVDVGPHGLVWVLHLDGVVMFREPSEVDPMGQSAHDHPLLVRSRSGPSSGFVRAPIEAGGPVYLSGYRQLHHPPLLVAVSLSQGDVLADWRREVAVVSCVLVIVALLLALAMVAIGRELQERTAVDQRASSQATALASALAERDEATVGLRASQAQFQAIMDHTPVIVLVKDLEGHYTFVNRAAEQWVGAVTKPAVGKTSYDIMHHDLAEQADAVDRQVSATNSPIQREWTLQTPAGRRTMLSVKFPLTNDAGNVEAVGTIAADVTDRKNAEAQLAHAQRMEAIGQLTGGVAHDFNNMLTAILLNADVLATQLHSDSLRPLAEAMRLAAERGAELTGRLLAFGRRQTLAPQPTDVNELLAGMEPLMHRTLGEHIEIKLMCGSDVGLATIDPGQLENAVLNLAFNARDAMPNGGRLTIETANVEFDADYAAVEPDVKPGSYVMIAVTDTGTGMKADVLARAFEPFFTTKEVGKGTGLGLSMVYGFVKQSEGHVRIYSEPGIGTVIKLYLLRSLHVEASVAAPSTAATQPATGHETILLVEDDRLVRAHAEIQLRSLGYEVVASEDANKALEAVERGCVPDLLFTDMVMPGGINGHELALRLRRRWPGLKVLYTSGYAHGMTDAISTDPTFGRHMLAKPYRRRDLAAKVREVLDEPAAAS
jgi:PAS domain S-box-containing protein